MTAYSIEVRVSDIAATHEGDAHSVWSCITAEALVRDFELLYSIEQGLDVRAHFLCGILLKIKWSKGAKWQK
jgi:hypothetical protein